MLARSLAVAATLAAPGSAWAGQTTAAFLKIPVDSRALALGEGYSAAAVGAGALASNPAGLSASSAKELSLHYARHLDGLSLGHMGVVLPSRRHGSFGAALLTLRSDNIDARDAAGKQTGSFTAEDRAIALSWGFAFLPNSDNPSGALKAGLSAKSISSRLASYEAHSYAFDAGVQLPARIARLPLRLGLVARNLGPGLKFSAQSDPLPLNLAVGLCAQPWRPASIFAGLSRFIYEQRNEFSVGGEFSPLTGLFLRAGGGVSQTQGGLGRLPTLAAGLGLRLSRYQLDYAIRPLGDLGMTQRMSLTFRFGPAYEGEPARARRLKQEGLKAVRTGRLSLGALRLRQAQGADPADAQLKGMAARAEAVAAIMPELVGMESPMESLRPAMTIFVEGRKLKEAVRLMRSAHDAKPQDAGVFTLLQRVEQEAGAEITQRDGANPGQGFVAGQLQAARRSASDGRYAEALRRVANALDIEPRNILGWEILGSIYYLKGEKILAERAWRKALSLDPGNESLKEAMKNLLATSAAPVYVAGVEDE